MAVSERRDFSARTLKVLAENFSSKSLCLFDRKFPCNSSNVLGENFETSRRDLQQFFGENF
ncbi:hypothetical protein LINPERHAP1_LOCUS18161, partial [Linum perenne]